MSTNQETRMSVGESGPRVFYVCEAASGQKRCGPIKGAQADFSRTGRWIVCYFFNQEEPQVMRE